MRNPFQLSIIASTVILAGCGGSGGGPIGVVRNTVPYHTPTQINHFTPQIRAESLHAYEAQVYTKDLNNDKSEEVVVSGMDSSKQNLGFNMQVYGWNTGSFKNETKAWFTGNDNQIVGGVDVEFADFNGDGNLDMHLAGGTDTNDYYADQLVFFNTGNNKFIRTKLDLPHNMFTHDSEVYDFNGDGYYDIITLDYNKQNSISFGNADGTFTSYVMDPTARNARGASGVAVGDFLDNGSTTIILTDSSGDGNRDTNLFSYTTKDGKLDLVDVAQLPASRFSLAKWDSVRHAPGHAIRTEAMDFNHDGLMDVIVFEWMWNPLMPDNRPSEVQFLRNNGNGDFSDVTEDVLVNYDHNRNASYAPLFMDVNNDGLVDIFLSSSDYPSGPNQRPYHDSTRVLIQTSDGKFVEKYAEIGTDFSQQMHSMTGNSVDNWTQPVHVVKGPNNELYLFGTVVYEDQGIAKTATYLSKIGESGTITPQSVTEVLGSVWPYLSDVQKNKVLARTSSRSLNDTQIIDLNDALEPVGDLTMNGSRISGTLSVAGLNTSTLNRVTALDEIGRNYEVDLTPLGNNYTPLVETVTETRSLGVTATGDNITYNIGADTSMFIDSDWRFGFGIGKQKTNPWLNFDGMFGTVQSTQTIEVDISKEYSNGMWHRAGLVQYQTDFSPGLVTDIQDLWSGYAVLGYKEQGLNVFGGLKPTLVSGSITVELPNGVDKHGSLMYTAHKIDVRNKALGFIGLDYNFVLDITKKLEYNVNAQIDSAGNRQGTVSAGLPW